MRDTSNIWALLAFYPCYMWIFLLILCPSCFAVSGDYLSPRSHLGAPCVLSMLHVDFFANIMPFMFRRQW